MSNQIQTQLQILTGNLFLDSKSVDQAADQRTDQRADQRAFLARFVRAGVIRTMGNTPSKYTIKPEALQKAAEEGLFNAKAVFIDHAGYFDNASLRNLVAVTEEAQWNEETQSVDGSLRFYDTPDAGIVSALLSQILVDEDPPDVGISIVFYPFFEGDDITRINYVESVDLVFQPAAGGKILKALSILSFQPPKEKIMSIQDVVDDLPVQVPAQDPPSVEAAREDVSRQWLDSLAVSASKALIDSSGLPKLSRDRLAVRTYANPAEVQAAIDEERAFLAALSEDKVVTGHGVAPRGSQIQMGRDGFEQFQLAFEAMLDGVRPPDGIRPLSGIREFYNLVSGDYELTGRFHADRVYLASVNSDTMAGLVANALNKRVVNKFAEYPKWWEPIVIEEDFATLQQLKWITLAGVGSLPTVLEGGPYTELNWDDKTETADFIKKGGYLGITLEAIDKDDTRRLRAAPQALAQGAYLTLSKAVSDLFTANAGVGPTMSDTKALFHIDHGNLGTSSLDPESWASTRQAMRDQVELGASGAPVSALGALTAPRYMLVPNELENTALEILGGFLSGSADYTNANIWAEGDTLTERMRSARSRVVVVDLWTDVNNWAAVADPLLYATIGIGYRYGRVPEIFSVANPTSGLMFTNDVMPVKVRFFFGVGAMDWRGLYKHNVA